LFFVLSHELLFLLLNYLKAVLIVFFKEAFFIVVLLIGYQIIEHGVRRCQDELGVERLGVDHRVGHRPFDDLWLVVLVVRAALPTAFVAVSRLHLAVLSGVFHQVEPFLAHRAQVPLVLLEVVAFESFRNCGGIFLFLVLRNVNVRNFCRQNSSSFILFNLTFLALVLIVLFALRFKEHILDITFQVSPVLGFRHHCLCLTSPATGFLHPRKFELDVVLVLPLCHGLETAYDLVESNLDCGDWHVIFVFVHQLLCKEELDE